MDSNAAATDSRSLRVIRWIALLPLAVLGGWVAWIVVYLGNRVTLAMMGMGPDGLVDRIFTELIAGAATGTAFVWVGAKVAPSSRKRVVFVLAGVAIVVVGYWLYPAIARGDGWAIFSGLCVSLGAGGLAWSVHAEGPQKHRL